MARRPVGGGGGAMTGALDVERGTRFGAGACGGPPEAFGTELPAGAAPALGAGAPEARDTEGGPAGECGAVAACSAGAGPATGFGGTPTAAPPDLGGSGEAARPEDGRLAPAFGGSPPETEPPPGARGLCSAREALTAAFMADEPLGAAEVEASTGGASPAGMVAPPARRSSGAGWKSTPSTE